MKKGDVYYFMLLWQEVETFKKKHKIIDVPFFFLHLLQRNPGSKKQECNLLNEELIIRDFQSTLKPNKQNPLSGNCLHHLTKTDCVNYSKSML